VPRPAAVTGRYAIGAVAGSLVLMLVALGVGDRWPAAALVAVTALAAAGLAAEVVLARADDRRNDVLARVLLGPPPRFLARDALVLAGLFVLLPGWRWWQAGLAVAAAGAVQAAQLGAAALVLLRQRAYDPVVAWQNLPPPLPRALAHPVGRALDDRPTALFCDAGLVAGALAGALAAVNGTAGSARTVVVVGALLTLAAAAAAVIYVAAGVVQARQVRAGRPGGAPLERALTELAPQVLVYFSGPAETSHALVQWLGVFEQSRRPVLIVLRENWHLPRLGGTRLPIVVLPSASELHAYLPASARVALYPANAGRNDHLLAHDGIRHSFIGHGDSDKGASFNPSNRRYDEIWVAGQAGQDRYLRLNEGFRPDQFVQVGRPQLAGIHRTDQAATATQRRVPTVAYLPTWEGYYDAHDYSSLATMGERIVAGLLAAGVRVLFKPHPATGLRLPRARDVADAISATLAASPGGHETLSGRTGDLYDAFNRADILVSDVSSVVSDYLASRKPYIVTNPRGLPHEEFRITYPAASAAHLLDPGADTLPDAVRESLDADSWRARREQLADYLLGPAVPDPVGRFFDEVDAFVVRAGGVRR